MSSSQWYVYILRCHDGSLYTGVSTDVSRRLVEHNHGSRGARYTRSRRPVSLLYHESVGSRSEAQQREYAIRRLNREGKLALAQRGET